MQSEIKAKIGKLIYHLSNENRASADRELKEVIKMKVQSAFDKEYARVQSSFSQENK